MIPGKRIAIAGFAGLLFLGPRLARAQQTDYLTGPEQDKLRDAQDPSERIKVYLDFQQSRLDVMEGLRMQQPGLDQNPGSDFGESLREYISITDEMKDWISDQFQRHGDMRKGLRDLLERGPHQVEELRHLEAESAKGGDDAQIQTAIEDMTDAIDGSAKALSDQQKEFGELKKQGKLDAKQIKENRKEQEKRLKKEEKLRKRLDQQRSKEEAQPQN
jgi:hypothetical protein